MSHALIIDDNMIISRAVQHRLGGMGFDSFDQTWTEAQALAAANRKPPDLIVIGDSLADGSAFEAARKIAAGSGTPVLMVSGDRQRANRRLQRSQDFAGPFLFNEIETAVTIACSDGDQTRPVRD